MATAAPQAMTASQLASMDAGSRMAYFAALPADQQAAQMAAYRSFQSAMNRSYMKNTVRKRAVCPQASGGALIQPFSAGQTIPFTIPSAQNAFTEGIFVRATLTVTPATGTAAAYALNAGAPFTLFDNIIVNYNGTQHRFKPYILRQLQMLEGKAQMPLPYSVVAGQSVASTQAYLSSGFPLTVGAANVWNFEFYVPFNPIHPQDVRGLLPTMGGETSAQILITCAPQLLGIDPILNAVSPTTGTGWGLTVTGNVQVIAAYRDGTSMLSPALLGLDLSGLGTTQYALDIPLTGIAASTVFRQKLSIMDNLYYVFLTVVDGNQSNKFCANSNIQILEADKDSVGANIFWRVGTGTNLAVSEFFEDIRLLIQQDLDEGIIPLVMAPIYNLPEPGVLEGTHVLNTSTSGWTDYHYGIQLGTLGAAVPPTGFSPIQPRIEAHVILVNSAGLVSA